MDQSFRFPFAASDGFVFMGAFEATVPPGDPSEDSGVSVLRPQVRPMIRPLLRALVQRGRRHGDR